jgi:hypothetical protein
MRVARLAVVLLLVLTSHLTLGSQQSISPHRDAQALAVLAQALDAAGGGSTIGSVVDFSASGSITYFWDGKEVSGTVTLHGKGLNQFRLDAVLPSGPRSWAVNDSNGSISGSSKEAYASPNPIPYHNAVDFGSLTFPVAHILTALRDPGTNIYYLGLVVIDGHQAHQIRVEPFATEGDPGNMISKLNTKDFFIDTTTLQISGMRDIMHPDNNSTLDFSHEIGFSDYRIVSGALMPFSVTETIGGNRTWTIELTQIAVNGGLSDTVFQP